MLAKLGYYRNCRILRRNFSLLNFLLTTNIGTDRNSQQYYYPDKNILHVGNIELTVSARCTSGGENTK